MKLLIITQKVDEESDVLGFFIEWIRAFAYNFDEVKVVCQAKGSYNLPESVEVVSLGKEKGRSKIFQILTFYLQASRLLTKTDAVLVHMSPEFYRALHPLNIIFRKPVILWYAHIRVSPLAKWAIKHVDRVFTPSKESFEYDSPKVVATGHGINTEVFTPSESKATKDILTISRISKVKRVETLIEALNILVNERGLGVKVSMYGAPARAEDGEYEESLKSLIKSYNLKDSWVWCGPVANKDAPSVYGDHKVFVTCAEDAAFGKTTLEAMACGVIAILPTRVYEEDLGEFARELYFNEDDSKMLADKIERVFGWSEEKRANYSKLTTALVREKHNIKNLARRLREEFEILNQN